MKVKKDDCLFCKIAAGEIPSKKVYEDNEFYAFHDIRPAAPVHVLLIPREHIATLSDCGVAHELMLGKMMRLASRLAGELGVAYTPEEEREGNGFRTVINTGPGGGQEVYHLHLHILGGERPWARMG